MLRQRGLTLVELMVTLSVLVILLSTAVPSFIDMFERHRLVGAAEAVFTHLQFAKSESLKRNKTVKMGFQTSGNDWCFGLTEEDTWNGSQKCDCTSAGSCWLDLDENGSRNTGEDFSLAGTRYPGVTLVDVADDTHLNFNPARSTSNGATIKLASADGQRMHIVVSGYGRILLCSPAGANKVSGFEDCQ